MLFAWNNVMLRWFFSLSGLLLVITVSLLSAILATADYDTPIPVYIENSVDPNASMSRTTIYAQTATTGEQWVLYEKHGWFEASLAPSNAHALMWNHDAMYVELANLRRGQGEPIANVSYLPRYIHPQWSADGQSVIFVARTYSQTDNNRFEQFVTVNTQDVVPVELDAIWGLYGDLGQTDERLFYVNTTDRFYTLYQYDPITGADERISAPNHADFNPSSSPDGTQLVYTSQRALYNKLYLLDLTTGEETHLMDDPDVRFGSTAVWSPDGRFIAYSARQSGAHPRSVYLVDTYNNNHITTIVDAPSEDSRTLYWSADSEWIAFRADLDGTGITGYMLHLPTGDLLPLADRPQRGMTFIGFLNW